MFFPPFSVKSGRIILEDCIADAVYHWGTFGNFIGIEMFVT
jgi:hypothetical protein